MELKKELVLRDIAGDFVLIPTGTTVLENNGLFTINEVAARIWELLPGRGERGRADRRTGGGVRRGPGHAGPGRGGIPGQAAVAGHPMRKRPGRRLPAICLFSAVLLLAAVCFSVWRSYHSLTVTTYRFPTDKARGRCAWR